MVYVVQVCRQPSSRIRMELQFHPDPAARKLSVWHVPLLSVQWVTPHDEQRNCPKHVEFHFQNKFEKLVHLVGFYYKETKAPRFGSGSASVCKREATKLLNPLHRAILNYRVPQKHSALPCVCDQLGYREYSVSRFERVRSEILLRQLTLINWALSCEL
jgi:hypothetical protein